MGYIFRKFKRFYEDAAFGFDVKKGYLQFLTKHQLKAQCVIFNNLEYHDPSVFEHLKGIHFRVIRVREASTYYGLHVSVSVFSTVLPPWFPLPVKTAFPFFVFPSCKMEIENAVVHIISTNNAM